MDETKQDTFNPLNRETWLGFAVDELRPMFKQVNLTIPEDLKVSCGWPSKLALSSKKRRIGECWTQHQNIFISPYLSKPVDVLATLTHELIHACFDGKVGHKAPFPRYCKMLGLEGKPTETVPDEALVSILQEIADKIGPYPHQSVDGSEQRKKQTTRLRLWVCACEEPIKVRVASDAFDATCNVCEGAFKQPE